MLVGINSLNGLNFLPRFMGLFVLLFLPILLAKIVQFVEQEFKKH